MKSKAIFILCCGIIISSEGCDNRNTNNKVIVVKSEAKKEEKRQWMKEYALCKCITQLSTDTLLKKDISMGIYFNITDYGSDKIYNAVDSAAKQAVSQINPSQIADYGGKKPYMLSCIEFSKSKKLDSLIRTYDSDLVLAF